MKLPRTGTPLSVLALNRLADWGSTLREHHLMLWFACEARWPQGRQGDSHSRQQRNIRSKWCFAHPMLTLSRLQLCLSNMLTPLRMRWLIARPLPCSSIGWVRVWHLSSSGISWHLARGQGRLLRKTLLWHCLVWNADTAWEVWR